ncbi:MAG: pyridoxamine 5'-phosphate oxidase family protein [Candidatus Nanohaloarchaea archaeon]
MKLEILEKENYEIDKVRKSIKDIISSNKLLSMSTVADDIPHINTCFYAFDEEMNLYILTPPETEHGKKLEQNDSVAVDIHDSNQEWTDEKQGLQIFGRCRKADDREKGLEIYSGRFPTLEEFASGVEELEDLNSDFYIIDPERIKVFDEPRFGKETWIEVELS